ncbi:MAG TPA: amidohydrolase family protein [Longimicrobiaceae bacterium]|jgi:beta-aspartyl-dipeptidase (metallo-type)|nr:amidohydrolase family protein [Longimicrobiaceae bacterium]
MLTLIENGEVYTPDPVGRQSILLTDGKIGKVGKVDRRAVEALGLETTVIDASGCIVIPGLIDPHQHLLGGSGEEGFNTQTPEFFIAEIVAHGITTIVGVLGVDTTMKTMPGLLAKVKGLKEDGLNAYCWSGGYAVPPTSIMQSVREDIMFIDEVIGAGEVAISDLRGIDPSPRDLARLATDCYVGGMLAKKAGLVHVHVGDRPSRLQPLRDVLEGFNVEPCWFYATHIERSKTLMREAIALAKKGMPVDIDTVEEDLPKWLRYYRENGGPPDLLTISSDASINSPRVVWEQIRSCIRDHGSAIEEVIPHATRNTARILKLAHKGELAKGKAGDVVILEKETLEIVHVLSDGLQMVRDGRLVCQEKFLENSNREVHLVGQKDGKDSGGEEGEES